MRRVTCQAPVNIALIKYWGKEDEELITPINASISLTLDIDHLHAKTTVAVSNSFTDDRIWLNGVEESIDNPRIRRVINEIRRLVRKRSSSAMDKNLNNEKVHICSENNFPTAAGLASSAAGYACLVATLANAFSIDNANLSIIARQGSGSACRSMYGGFVEWQKANDKNANECISKQIFTETHWPELRVLIIVVNEGRKATGSSSAMQRSIQTSDLLKHRANAIVPDRIQKIRQYIADHDFHKLAEITMKESNQLHAVCLDTYPPVFYLNDTSRAIINLVHTYNDFHGENKAAYTFDAGPNAFILLTDAYMSEFLGLIQHFFPSNLTSKEGFIRGINEDVDKPRKTLLDRITIPIMVDSVKYVIATKSGSGPREMSDNSQHLLNGEGLPTENSIR